MKDSTSKYRICIKNTVTTEKHAEMEAASIELSPSLFLRTSTSIRIKI